MHSWYGWGDDVFPSTGLVMDVDAIQPDDLGEQTLDEPVPAHHGLGPIVACLGEPQGTIPMQHDETVTLHPAHGLGHGRSRLMQPVDDASPTQVDALLEQFVERTQVHLGRVNEFAHLVLRSDPHVLPGESLH